MTLLVRLAEVLDNRTNESMPARVNILEMRPYGDRTMENETDLIRQDTSSDSNRKEHRLLKMASHRDNAPTQTWITDSGHKDTLVSKLIALLGCSKTAAPWYVHRSRFAFHVAHRPVAFCSHCYHHLTVMIDTLLCVKVEYLIIACRRGTHLQCHEPRKCVRYGPSH